jgi:hypothetical protein
MNDLIDKFLNEQTTPEEEHRLANMLRQEADIDAWIEEDETDTYERIVSQRHRRRLVRWAAAAILVMAVVAGATLLWPQDTAESTVAKVNHTNPADEEPATAAIMPDTVHDAEPQQPVRMTKTTTPVKEKPSQVKTVDSLQIYIARLEKELDEVSDSDYATQAEQIIKADARLQRLVQRIMIGEINKGEQSAEVVDTKEKKEEGL